VKRLDLSAMMAAAALAAAAASGEHVVIYEGGVYDFEAGFVMHRPSLFPTREWDEVGRGWRYWGRPALFQPPRHRYGHPSFNRNRFAPNVSAGVFSQEITMTSANGDAVMWIAFDVPPGRRIRCVLDAVTTPSEDDLELRHGILQADEIDALYGFSDPDALPIDWKRWNTIQTQGGFGSDSVEIVASGGRLAYCFWVRHTWATSSGATLCIDNLRVVDADADAQAASPSAGGPSRAGR
jgi:hypothetical protein